MMWQEYLLLLVIGFVTGVINTMAGGGSVLTLPLLIFLGLPPNVANGTNRVAIFIQGLSTAAGFRSKSVKTFPFSIYFGFSAMLGAMIGAQIAVDIKEEIFNRILAIVIVLVGFFLVFHKDRSKNFNLERLKGKYLWLSTIAFFFIGIYGGFIQAGTGLIMLMVLSGINHYALVKANAIKNLVTLVFNISALAIFIFNDKVNWEYGLMLAVGTALGGWFTSRWSVNKGDGIVRIFMIIMIIIMATKLWFFND
ncbi:MAG: sulfite exporter TauE/SafE family protein [Lutimonas sp.]